MDKTIVEDCSINPTLLNTLEVDEAVLETVRTGLRAVATEGTAASVFGGYEISIGGKTGTSEGAGSDSGLFVAFAPYNDPEIAIAIVGEHAVHGSWMAPVAKDILDEYFFGTRSQGETLQVGSGLLQ